ncbi:DUF1062 domain-containing protein [Chryseobacterium phosphatilyticum]|uniref:DUF1062 domain-containing protein n=1 Tax=Chryseobacterium phosphatilyticum TaxID=475075 RepID=A0A316XD83_9FLAO|nr:DUF1062 domain-containing protein [Chryseobacterium phosphatilyticum]PWN71119.1 DUF1062 domain-containing protein [Chryseobacterium phosphatilyticum]
MSQQHIWEVKTRNTPLLKKKCNHCDGERFYCSDKFRLNAQKKNIDIWLIYRCVKCKSRYNMTLFSRIRTESITKEIFNKFSENNVDLAWKYAFSYEIRKKNNVEADLDSVEYDILYSDILEDMAKPDNEELMFIIKCPLEFGLKISSVVRTCLGLSSGKLDQLIEMNAISVQEKSLQKKHKIKDGDIVYIDKEKLLSICSAKIV